MAEIAIELQSVCKKYGQRPALTELSLQVKRGELLVLIGPSGCGKSTLLRLIAGLETPTSGSIRLNGLDASKLEPRHRGCAMAFQDGACYEHWTVQKNIQSATTDSKQADLLLELFGLSVYREQLPSRLSGGERQRLSLIRALVSTKPILLLDEPLAQLHPKLRNEARKRIQDQHRLGQKTTIYVTHDLDEAVLLGDRIAILDEGKLGEVGKPQSVFAGSGMKHLASYLGEIVCTTASQKYVRPNAWFLTRIGDRKIPAGFSDGVNLQGKLLSCRWCLDGWELEVALEPATEAVFGTSSMTLFVAHQLADYLQYDELLYRLQGQEQGLEIEAITR